MSASITFNGPSWHVLDVATGNEFVWIQLKPIRGSRGIMVRVTKRSAYRSGDDLRIECVSLKGARLVLEGRCPPKFNEPTQLTLR